MIMEKGYVQIYTGSGKGKTTAMLGLCLRAAGSRMKVFIGQFLKKGQTGETVSLERFPEITLRQFGTGDFFIEDGNSAKKSVQKEAAAEGLRLSREALCSGEFDVVALDEIIVACFFGLISENDVLSLIDSKPESTELLLTGRGAAQTLIERADLVTEMREIKHYYAAGVHSRPGIED